MLSYLSGNCGLRDAIIAQSRPADAQAATAALTHTDESSWRSAISAANITTPTTSSHARGVLLPVCGDGDDVLNMREAAERSATASGQQG